MRLGLPGDERAGATVVAAALMLVMFLVGVVLHDVAALYGARGKAQTAADAAAKAAGLELTPYFGVGNDPGEAARQYAMRNGSDLLECSYGAGDRYLWVTVRVSRRVDLLVMGNREALVTATARCYLDPYPQQSMTLPSTHARPVCNPLAWLTCCVSRPWREMSILSHTQREWPAMRSAGARIYPGPSCHYVRNPCLKT